MPNSGRVGKAQEQAIVRHAKANGSPPAAIRGPRPRSAAIRLAERLRASGDCLFFVGARRNGYGVLVVGSRSDGTRRLVRAHRLAWELVNGPVPPGIFVCHHCDNPACCKVEHLFLGSARDNTQDMLSKGRNGDTGRPGVLNGRARLKVQDVQAIRRRAASGERQCDLAAEFGVSRSTVFGLVHRLTWTAVL